jgi:DNA replication initiation complex subunit (GINS family)
MSSIQNNHTTINIYNLPPRTENLFSKTSGLTLDNSDFEKFGDDDDAGDESGIDKLPLPGWAKALLKNMLGDSSNGLPSSADAAKNLRDFQKENGIGLLNVDQVKQMADTGYVTMPGGEKKMVPPDVQAAAEKMMANNGELFKKLETAIRPEHDGLLSAADYDAALKDGSIGKPGTEDQPTEQALDMKNFLKSVMSGALSPNRPTEYNAAKTIQGFQEDHNIKHLNIDQIQKMAETGYCKMPNGERIQVPPDVQEAAQKMMDNNCELFKKLETAIRKDADGLLSTKDVDQAEQDGLLKHRNDFSGIDPNLILNLLRQLASGGADKNNSDDFTLNLPGGDGGNGLPSSANAGKTIQSFQKDHGIKLMNIDQIQQMAETGYCTSGGKTFQVPPDAQAAAMKMMDNNAALFKTIESAQDGKHDGKLSAKDYDAAVKDGSIGKPGTPDLPGSDGDSDMIQNLQLQFLKALLERIQSGGDDDNDLTLNLKFPTTDGGNGLPSSADAGKTIQTFQKDHDIKNLSVDQVQQMADTGYCKMPGGETIQVPPDVQAAAKKMMDNNGEVFKSIETAIRANHDGLLSAKDYDAAVKDGRIGKPGTQDLPDSDDDSDMIQNLQQQFLKALMNRINSDGDDDQDFDLNLPTGDAGNGLPSSADAGKTIQSFQKDHGIKLMNIDQIQQMAETGYCTSGGKTFQVPPDAQAAAMKMMDNNAELFKTIESAQDGKHDGKLSAKDYDAAVKDGSIGKPGTPDLPDSDDDSDMIQDMQQQFMQNLMNRIASTDNADDVGDDDNALPASSDAAKTIQTFQKDNKIDLMNVDQVKQMADTGYITMPGGEMKQVPPDVQEAAKKLMDNNGELFKSLETSIRANHDGLLSAKDYDAALKDGRIGEPGTDDL